MVKNIVVLTLFFYFITLIETSFLAHFAIFGLTLDIVLISVILMNLYIPSRAVGFGSAFIGGFFLDVFSSKQFGWNILFFLAIAFFIKIVFKRYVRIPVK